MSSPTRIEITGGQKVTVVRICRLALEAEDWRVVKEYEQTEGAHWIFVVKVKPALAKEKE